MIQKIRDKAPEELKMTPFAKAIKQKNFDKDLFIDDILLRKSVFRNPISRFQYDVNVSKPDGELSGSGWLYFWNEERQEIKFKPEIVEHILPYKVLFNEFIVYKAVKFLEQVNFTPRLTEKITIEINRQRISSAIRSMFKEYNTCFYCNHSISDNLFHLDHFIPWEYVLSHDIWNLVVSCPSCNNGPGGKFIKIPELYYLEKLNHRNAANFSALKINKNFKTPDEVQQRLADLYDYALRSGYEMWRPVRV